MNHRNLFSAIMISSLFMALVLILGGCGQQSKSVTRQGHMDSPEFHVGKGDDALIKGDYNEAHKSFKRALELDEKNAKALSGLAVADASRASSPSISDETKNKVLVEAQVMLEQAEDLAANDQELARVHSYAIQVYYRLKQPADWYDKVKDHFKQAMSADANHAEAHFYMAGAEAEKGEFSSAVAHLEKVLMIGGSYEVAANEELKRIQRIQRALPGSRFGDKIANVTKMTRGDVAALFYAELKLDKLFAKSNSAEASSFQPPKAQRRMEVAPAQTMPAAVDLSGHPLKSTIEEILTLGIKGLEADASHKFYPGQEISRAEFALMVEDILVKVTGDQSLSTKFLGQPSPFPDVRDDMWYYNAVQTVVNRGLMEAADKRSGNFAPLGPVSGADALLTIRSLKEMLKSYLR